MGKRAPSGDSSVLLLCWTCGAELEMAVSAAWIDWRFLAAGCCWVTGPSPRRANVLRRRCATGTRVTARVQFWARVPELVIPSQRDPTGEGGSSTMVAADVSPS